MLMHSLMELNSLQSIRVFGLWDQPRSIFTWDDVKQRCWTWLWLRDRLHFTAEELFTVQPDKSEWVKRGALTLHDMMDMTVFPLNPIDDLHADLAEIWSMKWSAEDLLRMGVNFQQIKRCGLNYSIMLHFNFALSAWSKLGFGVSDAHDMRQDELRILFGLEQNEVVSILECQSLPVSL